MSSISRKLALRKYRQSQKGKATQSHYNATRSGKAKRREIGNRYAESNREKRNAIRAVQHAKRRGRLPAASAFPCFVCVDADAEHYHHRSYERSQRLVVTPVCRPCHVAIHYGDQIEAVERIGMLRGWVRQNVVSHEAVSDRFGREGYAGTVILRLSCGHLKSIRGSAVIPATAHCKPCANQHRPDRPEAGL